MRKQITNIDKFKWRMHWHVFGRGFGLIVLSLALLCPSLKAGALTKIEVVNGESSGYIQVMVDGKDVFYEREVLERDANGKILSRRIKRIWQAGPGHSIWWQKWNWSTAPKAVTVIVKYFRDDGGLIGISQPRTFWLETTPGPHELKWVFHKSDLSGP